MGKKGALIVMPSLYRGGAETQFRYLLSGLYKRNFPVKCLVIDMDSDNNQLAKKFKENFRNDTIIYCDQRNKNHSKFSKFIWNILNEYRILMKIRSIITTNNFSTVIVYDVKGLLLIPFIKLSHTKVIYSERNSGRHKHSLINRIINIADIITTNSDNAYDELGSKINKNKIHLIYNGVFPGNRKIKDISRLGKLNIIVPARITPVKNQMVVLKAIIGLDDVVVHFAGGIEDPEYYQELLNFTTENKISEKVVFDGFVTDMISYYKNFDFAILPSLSEGTPNVILECFANNILCVASDIEMNRKVITNRKYLFTSDDEESLEYVIKSIKGYKYNQIESDLKENYQFVVEKYSVNKMIDSYIELI